LFRSAFSRDITFYDFTSSLDISGIGAIDLIQKLVEAKILFWQTLTCEYCGKEITMPRIYCLSCRNDISNQIVFHTEGCIEDKDKEDFLLFPTMKMQARQFSNKLTQQGYMYYMLLDVAESEYIQAQNSVDYNDFFESIREIMKREALSQRKKDALSFGEVGDCLKLAFLSEVDFITAMEKFSLIVQKLKFEEQFPRLKGRETIFPRFDGTVGKIIIPKYYDKLEKIFCITLNGGIDFNDYELTKFFRLDKHIKTKKCFYSDTSIISLWVQEEVFTDLKWENMALIEIEDNTHNLIKKGKFGLVGFDDKGKCFCINEPSKYNE